MYCPKKAPPYVEVRKFCASLIFILIYAKGKIKYFIKKLLVVFLLLKQKSKRKYNQKYNQPFVNCNKTKMMY